MQCSTVLRVALLLSCFCCDLSAQTKPAETPPLQAQPLPIKPLKKVPPKPKLTPQQEQGFRMLKSAQGEAAGLEAVTRSYMLWKISHGYRKADPVKADTTLRRAFFATRGIQDNVLSDGCRMPLVCDMQGWMQSSILIEMLTGHDKRQPRARRKTSSTGNSRSQAAHANRAGKGVFAEAELRPRSRAHGRDRSR